MSEAVEVTPKALRASLRAALKSALDQAVGLAPDSRALLLSACAALLQARPEILIDERERLPPVR